VSGFYNIVTLTAEIWFSTICALSPGVILAITDDIFLAIFPFMP
jgi:hypothetical protein